MFKYLESKCNAHYVWTVQVSCFKMMTDILKEHLWYGSVAAENKKNFQLVSDKKDGYEFVYPFGWQEVTIEGQDKVFKDVIEPLETASVTLFPTVKQDIKEFGSPQEVS